MGVWGSKTQGLGIVMQIPYIETVKYMGIVSRKPLKPTGRWKIESCAYYKDRMFVEHQGWIFKHWIDENSIVFCPANSTEIFTCA